VSETLAGLRHKIGTAGDLQSVVRTMKALAASNIAQYENSVRSLTDYYHAVELGLRVCLRGNGHQYFTLQGHERAAVVTGLVVFGSDQGLVGQFNEVVIDFMQKKLSPFSGEPVVWAVGDRVYDRLTDEGLQPTGVLDVPNSVNGITPFVGQVLRGFEKYVERGEAFELYIFYNELAEGELYSPVSQRLLPLDENWISRQASIPWPTSNLPEVIGNDKTVLRAFIREYLFASLFRACAESLASENASRLAAMRRADKKIEDMLTELTWTYHRLRQTAIDEELFDVVAGFEAQSGAEKGN
jgi:F-type H+-transporting ATPase subunit gamma